MKAEIICGIEQLDDDDDEIALDVDEFEFDTINDMNERKCIEVLKKKGKLATAGRDFIRINQVGSAVFILYSAVGLAKDTISPLLGESASPELAKLVADMLGIILMFMRRLVDMGPGTCSSSKIRDMGMMTIKGSRRKVFMGIMRDRCMRCLGRVGGSKRRIGSEV